MKQRSVITKAMRCRWMLDDALFRIQQIWWRIWNAGIKRYWYELFPPKDEFHPAYNLDHLALIALNETGTDTYRASTRRRRVRAHG